MDPKKLTVIIFILSLMLMSVFMQAQAFQAASAENEILLPLQDPGFGLSDTVLVLPEGNDAPGGGDPADDIFCLAEEKPDTPNCGTDEILPLSKEQTDKAMNGTDPELVKEAIMDYTMEDLDGKMTRLGDLIPENRITMLNIWGISCAPCLMEIPNLVELRDQFRDRGFEIIGLASDLLAPDGKTDPDLTEEARELVTELEVPYPILVLTGEIRKQMQIIATPTTIFVNDKGQVIGDVIMGVRSKAEWEHMVRDILDHTANS